MGIVTQSQMTIQSGATVFIGSGARMTLQGDLNSSANITGPGIVHMNGSSLQNMNMNGFIIPNLEIDNTANVTLTGGNTKISTSLLFTNGKLLTGAQNLIMASAATFSGNNNTRFVWTNGTGQVKKELTADISSYEIPVGENVNYRPVYLTSTGNSYLSADVGVRVVGGAHINRPPHIANNLNTFWPVTRTGITGPGTVTISGQYIDPADVDGTETTLAGYYFNGTDWSSAGETHDYTLNRVAIPITGTGGDVYGMNKFITAGARAFLQGPYNSTTGLMIDSLRSGATGNLIPANDPYRSAPFTTVFSHVNNAEAEIAPASVLDQPADADDVVDWVFLELRNLDASPGNDILQTRSALLQRDGDIVDIDGTSPVTFNNITNGTYALSIRHRNHLSLTTDPTTPRTITETKSTATTTNAIDLRTMPDGQIFGPAHASKSSTHPTLGTVNTLWAGDANTDLGVRNSASPSDVSLIASGVANHPGNPIRFASFTGFSNVYNILDVTMDRRVYNSASPSDISVISSNVANHPANPIRFSSYVIIEYRPN